MVGVVDKTLEIVGTDTYNYDVGRWLRAFDRFRIAESYAVIVKPEHQRIQPVFVGLIDAMATLAGEHGVIGLHPLRFHALERVRRHGKIDFQDLLPLEVDEATPVAGNQGNAPVGRCDLRRTGDQGKKEEED